ncbi:Biorientation of chromosomes in cell division protein 1 [Melipona quadrifasciata]|uniref:Biorientation of chromosomes in cell division protein 1 n=1 Tax=Melipona quadrifasciata TaxID=166423 RepID=A0A0M9A2C9_9HYME|nr:Biorientation of chromosomes in cell division protein 1 [Melipona quadrifasciata]
MELGLPNTLLPGDPRLVDHIVGVVKSQGIFDQFRKECIADVDTKPAYQNLRTRVEGSVNSFLNKQPWKPDLNKNQLRETLRKHIHEAPYLDAGVERIVDQVVNPKVYSVFMHQIEDVVYKFLGIERPKAKEKNGACGLKDLLPKDLDPVSPESDKNSLKDVSLESMDAMEDLEVKRDVKSANEQKFLEDEISNEKDKDNISENGQISSEEKALDESDKAFNKTGSILNLNTSGKSDDKTEEDEEDSPTFEPIDIMNLNESNNSNDSHLSGISELTSHRSRSPDFCNELSRDNFDYSNQDSQLSKVSSDSRLDGSNGSSSKSSQSSNSGSNIAHSKSNTSTFSKETNHMSNSGSETSDNVEEIHPNDIKLLLEQQSYKLDKATELHTEYKTDNTNNYEVHTKQELEFNDVNLPLKKRALMGEDNSILGEMKVKKPKFAKNIHEAKKLMKIRKQIEKQKLKENKKLEKKIEKIEQPIQTNAVNNDNFESMPDEERVQIIEIPDEEYEEPYPEKHTNLTLEERSIMMLQTEVGTKDLLEAHSNLKLKLSDMELCIKKSLSETLTNKVEKPLSSNTEANIDSSISLLANNKEIEDSQNKELLFSSIKKEDNNKIIKTEELDSSAEICFEKETCQKTGTSVLEEVHLYSQESNYFSNKKEVNEKKEQLKLSDTNTDNMTCSSDNRNIEIPTTSKIGDEDVSQDAENSNFSNLNRYVTDKDCIVKIKEEPEILESTSMETEDNEDCRYFKADNEKSEKFSSFLESLELIENSSLEDIIESLGGQVVSSVPKAMAPPLPKRKHSSSPLTDILLNNSNNNNDGHKKALNQPNEEVLNNIKKRKLISKKQRLQSNICTPQGLLNGENFVMPLSPESDVSATSEKIPSANMIKEDKGRHRSSQRYSSDDLYKPRPLFSSSSRRSRRSNQASKIICLWREYLKEDLHIANLLIGSSSLFNFNTVPLRHDQRVRLRFVISKERTLPSHPSECMFRRLQSECHCINSNSALVTAESDSVVCFERVRTEILRYFMSSR